MFDETRDNTTAIEATIIEADKRAREESAPYPPAYPFPVFGGRPVKVAEESHPEHNDGANGYDDDDDIEEDDGQPSEYDEWQDFMGGDDWDHGQYDDCGWETLPGKRV